MRVRHLLFVCVGVIAALAARAAGIDGFDLVNATAERATHDGREAIHLVPSAHPGSEDMLAISKSLTLRDGVIDVDVAGAPLAGAPDGARGFIGIAFRVQPNGQKYECFYIRPANGRADDQLRRNHSTQYIAHPDYPWERLRKESPGVYESYADLEVGKWTHLRVVVEGGKARLFVNGASQPALIVNDLKLGAGATGPVAVWAVETTDAWFSGLRVSPK